MSPSEVSSRSRKSRNYWHFMKSECLFSCSEERTTTPYTGPSESSLHSPMFSIILPSTSDPQHFSLSFQFVLQYRHLTAFQFLLQALATYLSLNFSIILIIFGLRGFCFSNSLQSFNPLRIVLNSYVHNIKPWEASAICSASLGVSLQNILRLFSFIKCRRPVYLFSFIQFSPLQLFIVSRLLKLGVCFVLLAKFCNPTSYPLNQQNVVTFFFLRAWTFSFFSWKTNKRKRANIQRGFHPCTYVLRFCSNPRTFWAWRYLLPGNGSKHNQQPNRLQQQCLCTCVHISILYHLLLIHLRFIYFSLYSVS